MSFPYNYVESEHQGRLLLGDPQAEAYAWIMAYAAQITEQAQHGYSSGDANYTAEDLITIAESHKKGGWGDYICHGGAFEGESVDPLFWDKLSIVLDEEVPDEDRNGFFSCSCWSRERTFNSSSSGRTPKTTGKPRKMGHCG